MNDQTHCAIMDQAKRRIRWTRERDIALLAQVIAMGVRTFVTSKANTKDMKEEDKFNQGEAWTNTTDGILTMLGKHEAFSGIEMPGYQSVINHITGADGLLKKYVHLYKEGMEQDEPAAAGSEQTKDESANGEFENALIEVAELYEEAKAIEAGKSAAKKEAAGESKQAQRMQDEAVKKKYGEMSEEEYKKTQRARKRRSPSKSAGVKRVTVADYCKEHESADEETILEGKPPKGYLLIVPTGADDGEFDEPYLEEKPDTSPSTTAAGFREKLGDLMQSRQVNAEKKLKLEADRQALEQRKLDLEEKKHDALMKVLMAAISTKEKS